MSVTEITTREEYAAALKNAGEKLVVIDFFANWCGPCKAVAPHFAEFAKEFTSMVFLKINVDGCDGLAGDLGVSSIPDFRFMHKERQVGKILGGSKDKLYEAIKKQSEGLSSSSTSISADMYGIKGAQDLTCLIDKSASNCLNTENEGDWMLACLEHDVPTGSLKSECDEQLLLRITFQNPVKLFGIKIAGGDCGPNRVRIFTNLTNELDFDAASTGKSKIDIDIEPENLTADGNALKLVKLNFSKVRDVTLFFPGNHGDSDETEVSKIQFLGQPLGSSTDMKEFKRVAGKAGEAH